MYKAKKEWKLLEDIPFSGEDLTPMIVRFLSRNGDHISRDKVRQRTKKLGINLGQRHTEWLLEHQNFIPEEWKEYCLLFLGTIWQDHLGCCFVPSLDWDGESWCMYFRRLDGQWVSDFRLVSSQEFLRNRNFSKP